MASPRARFLVLFFLLLALFEIPLLLEPVDRNVVQPFTAGIATISGSLLNVNYDFTFQSVNLKEWNIGYTVNGPKKDYTIAVVYRRQT